MKNNANGGRHFHRQFPKPPAPPQPAVGLGHRLFPDFPGFGYELVTINGVTVWIACNEQDGWMVRRFSTPVFTSEADALAFKEQKKQERAAAERREEVARHSRLILPGSQEWNALAAHTQKGQK